MQNTYLDKDAMITRISNMQQQAQTIRAVLEDTRNIMEELKRNFQGDSANRLQAKYNELAESFSSLNSYITEKADALRNLASNISSADEN